MKVRRKTRQRLLSSVLALVLVITIAHVSPIIAFETYETETEWRAYLESIDVDYETQNTVAEIGDYAKANRMTYNEYGVVVYGMPGQVPGNEQRQDSDGKWQYRYLGWIETGLNTYTNPDFPNDDFIEGADWSQKNYLNTQREGGWGLIKNSDERAWVANNHLLYNSEIGLSDSDGLTANDINERGNTVNGTNEDVLKGVYASLLSAPGWSKKGSVYVRHQGASGVWYATMYMDGYLQGASALTLDADASPTTVTIASGSDSAAYTVDATADIILTGVAKAEHVEDFFVAINGDESSHTDGVITKSHSVDFVAERSKFAVGTTPVDVPVKAEFKTIFGETFEETKTVTVNVVVEEKDEPDLTLVAGANPTSREYKGSDINVTVTADTAVTGVNLADIDYIHLDVNGQTYQQSGVSAIVHPFSFTIPALIIEPLALDESYTEVFDVVSTAYLKNGSSMVRTAQVQTVVYKDSMAPVARITSKTSVRAGDDLFVSGQGYSPVNVPMEELFWDFHSDTQDPLVGFTQAPAPTINSAGDVWFPAGTEGVKDIDLVVYDDNRKIAYDEHFVTVTEPEIFAYVGYDGVLKENRVVTITGSSDSPDHYPESLSDRDWSMNYSSGLSAGEVVTKNYADTASSYMICPRDEGNVTTNLYVENTVGYSDTASQTLVIAPDLPPIVDIYTPQLIYRNPNNYNKASITVSNRSYSPDFDEIGSVSFSYRFDSDNDGSYEDEGGWVTAYSGANKSSHTFEVDSVGRYQIMVQAIESFPLVAGMNSSADFLAAEAYTTVTVDNIAPTTSIHLEESNIDVELDFLIGDFEGMGEAEVHSYVNSTLMPTLTNNGYNLSRYSVHTDPMEEVVLSHDLLQNKSLPSSMPHYYTSKKTHPSQVEMPLGMSIHGSGYVSGYQMEDKWVKPWVYDIVENKYHYGTTISFSSLVESDATGYANANYLKKEDSEFNWNCMWAGGSTFIFKARMNFDDRVGNEVIWIMDIGSGKKTYIKSYGKAPKGSKPDFDVARVAPAPVGADYDVALVIRNGSITTVYHIKDGVMTKSHEYDSRDNYSKYDRYDRAYMDPSGKYIMFEGEDKYEYDFWYRIDSKDEAVYDQLNYKWLDTAPGVSRSAYHSWDGSFDVPVYSREWSTGSSFASFVYSINYVKRRNSLTGELYSLKYDKNDVTIPVTGLYDSSIPNQSVHSYATGIYNNSNFASRMKNDKEMYLAIWGLWGGFVNTTTYTRLHIEKYTFGTSMEDYIKNSLTGKNLVHLSDNAFVLHEHEPWKGGVTEGLLDKGVTLLTVGDNTEFHSVSSLTNGFESTDLTAFTTDIIEHFDSIYKQDETYTSDILTLTLDEAVGFELDYYDYEDDPLHDYGFSGTHVDPNYFDNSLGTFSFAGYTLGSEVALDKVGLYELDFAVQDNPRDDNAFAEFRKWSDSVKTQMIVHRKPFSVFTIDAAYENGIVITDASYDLDHNVTDPNDGIITYERRWRHESDVEWTEGFPTVLTIGEQYYFSQRVQDMEYAWSDWYTQPFSPGPGGVPVTLLNANVRARDAEFTHLGLPASEWLTLYDIQTTYGGAAHHLWIDVLSDSTIPSFSVWYNASNYTEVDGILHWNDIDIEVPSNFTDKVTAVRIRAIDDAVPTAYDQLDLTIVIDTPVTVDGDMPDVTLGDSFTMTATTNEYATSVTARTFNGTANARSYPMTHVNTIGDTKYWEYSTTELRTIPSGNYTTRFTATTDNGNTATDDEAFTLIANQPPEIVNIATDPGFIYVGDDVDAIIAVDDPDDDILDMTVTVRFNGGADIATTNHVVAPIGGVYSSVRVPLLNNIADDVYDIVVSLDDGNGGSDNDTHTFSVNELTVDGFVSHTAQWEANRIAYNQAQTGTDDNPRAANVFWSGEKFMLDADTTDIDPASSVTCDSVTVEILTETFSTTLATLDNENWSGELWDEDMIDRWGRIAPETLTFRFTSNYSNGTIRIDDVNVIIDSQDDFYELHRLF